MSNISCSLVKDLMPLYTENLTTEETNKIMKEHIDSCKECKEFYSLCKDDFKISTQSTQKTDKNDRKIIAKMRFQYLWYMFWPMLYGIAYQFGWTKNLASLFGVILIAIISSTAYTLMDISFDPEKRKEYYEKENQKINTKKGSTFSQVVFIVFPILIPLLFIAIDELF